jgi:Family of unknown function (DUF5989)
MTGKRDLVVSEPTDGFFVRRCGAPTTLRRTLVGELVAHARARRKWWLLPIVGVFALYVRLRMAYRRLTAPLRRPATTEDLWWQAVR